MAMEFSTATIMDTALRQRAAGVSTTPGGTGLGDAVVVAPGAAQARAFADALHTAQQGRKPAAPTVKPPAFDRDGDGLGAQLVGGLNKMSGRLKADHANISRLLDKAVEGGDDKLMMRALIALGDYQQRVTMVSKSISKAGSSLDQLTKLQ